MISSAEILRDRLPETLAQMWDRWMALACQLDYGWFDAISQKCEFLMIVGGR